MIKMIVTALDNTLLRRDKTISEYTVNALNKCRERGILLVFATSRSEAASRRFTNIVSPDVMISNGGALARTGEQTPYKSVIADGDAAALVARFARENAVKQITVTASNGYFNSAPIDKNWAGWVDYADAVHTDFSRPIDFGEVYKMTIKAEYSEVIEEIAADFPSVYAQRFIGEDWYPFRNKLADKSHALKAVCAALGVSISETAAFGDDVNDLEMIKAAGTGVAMANAIPELKTAADCICGDCDDDGVAKWLYSRMLIGGTV